MAEKEWWQKEVLSNSKGEIYVEDLICCVGEGLAAMSDNGFIFESAVGRNNTKDISITIKTSVCNRGFTVRFERRK